MNRLMDRLQEGEEPPQNGYDILYLASHGAMVRGEPWLLLALESELEQQEKGLFRSGQVLAERMARQLEALPRLVVLASCGGAGVGMNDALYASGPRMAMAGVPAVMAMKGFVNTDMVEALVTRFFSEFQESEEVDQAMQAARARVQYDLGASDWWAPVLFMRLLDGRLASGESSWKSGKKKDEAAVASAPAVDMSRFDRVGLYQVMVEALDISDLQDLAFTMDVPFEELDSDRKSGLVREYIRRCERRNMIPALLKALADRRGERDCYAAAGLR